MPETIEKAKLVAGVPFHLLDDAGTFHFKRSYLGYLLGFPMVEGSLVDDAKDPWADGNFIVERRGSVEQGNYRDFDLVVLEVPEIAGIQRAETVYGRVVDQRLKPWDAGNFQVIRTETITETVNGREKKRIVQHLDLRDMNTFQFWKLTKVGADGSAIEVLYGRQVNQSEGPWAAGNFEVFLPAAAGEEKPKGWTTLDFNTDFPEQTWKRERVAPKMGRKSVLDRAKLFPIRFRENFSFTNWKGETTIDRDYLLATGPTLWKLLEEKIKSKREDGNDPCHYWLTLSYTEKPRGEGVDAPPEVTYVLDAEKMSNGDAQAVPAPRPAPAPKVAPPPAAPTKAPSPSWGDEIPLPSESGTDGAVPAEQDIDLDGIPF